MAYLIESIAQELGMEFVVDVDNGLVSYKFLVDATPAGATKKVSVKISEHNDVHEAIAWLNGYLYALEGHEIGKMRIASDPRPKRLTRE